MKYQAVLFDFDYTLGDATEAIFRAYTHALTAMGHPAPDREAVRRTVGMHVTDSYTQLTGDPDPANQQRCFELFHPVARDLQAQGMVDLLPGAVELLEGLKRAGVAACVVSTKNTDSLRSALRAKGAEDLFVHIVGGDRVSRPKPDPEGALWCLKALGLEPGQALYCGDTTIDAETARGAGCDFCAVLNGTTPASAFADYPHVHIAPDLWDVKNWLGI